MEYDNNQKLIGEHINAMKPGPLGPQDPTVLSAHQAEINRLMQTQSGIMQSAPVSGAQQKPQGQPTTQSAPAQTQAPQAPKPTGKVFDMSEIGKASPGDSVYDAKMGGFRLVGPAHEDGRPTLSSKASPAPFGAEVVAPGVTQKPDPIAPAPVAPAPAVSPVTPPQAAVPPGLPAFSPGASEGVTSMIPRIFPSMAPAPVDPYGSSSY